MHPSLKDRLRRDELTIGTWVSLACTRVAEVLTCSGFDWLVVDVEHSAATYGDIEDIIRVVQSAGVEALVRVSQNDTIEIRRVMDLGAAGVVVPMVCAKEEAAGAVAACRFPPEGVRGVSLCRANGYGLAFDRYMGRANRDAVVIVQIEHSLAIDRLEEILSVDGVDGSLIGPYDLSASLGCAGNFDDRTFVSALKRYEEVSKRLNKTMGYHVVEPVPSRAIELGQRGYRLLALGTDFVFLQTSRALVSGVRGGLPQGECV